MVAADPRDASALLCQHQREQCKPLAQAGDPHQRAHMETCARLHCVMTHEHDQGLL